MLNLFTFVEIENSKRRVCVFCNIVDSVERDSQVGQILLCKFVSRVDSESVAQRLNVLLRSGRLLLLDVSQETPSCKRVGPLASQTLRRSEQLRS